MNQKCKIFLSLFLLLAFYYLRHFLFYDRGIALFEEGMPFYVYNALAQGKLLYRDVFSYTAPLSNYFYALIIKLWGSELLTIRAVSIVVSSLGLCTIFLILKQFLNNFWSWIGAVISYSLYYLWFYKYGYELGSFFSFLAIFLVYLYMKTYNPNYFLLTILFSALACGHHLITQGIPLVSSIFITLVIIHKGNLIREYWTYLICVIGLNILVYTFLLTKVSFDQLTYNLFPFLQGQVAPVSGIANKFPFLNIFAYYNVHIPETIGVASFYTSMKGLLYVFIYYLPFINLVLFIINYFNFYKKLAFYKQFLYINILLYGLFSYARIYLFFPQGHSDAFFVAPVLLFFWLNIVFLLLHNQILYKDKVGLKKKLGIILITFIFYITIQIPNLNPELKESEFTYKHIKGIKSTKDQVEFVNKIIKTVKSYSKSGDYIYAQPTLINVVAERPSPIEDKLYLLRPLFVDEKSIDSEYLNKENLEKIEKEFVNILINKKVKVICFSYPELVKISKRKLSLLKKLLLTKYEIKASFNYNPNQYRHKIGDVSDIIIYVLKEK